MNHNCFWGFKEIEGRADGIIEFATLCVSKDFFDRNHLSYRFMKALKENNIQHYKNFAQNVKIVDLADIDMNWSYFRNLIITNKYSYETPFYTDVQLVNFIGFIKKSLFYDWFYFVNLKNETLEIYKGFNADHKKTGLYVKHIEKFSNIQICSCRLLIEMPISFIKQQSDEYIEHFLFNLYYLSNVLSINRYNYLPNDNTVIESFNNAKLFCDEFQRIKLKDKKNLIKKIVNHIWLFNSHNYKNHNKIQINVDFINQFPQNPLFIMVFQIFLNDKKYTQLLKKICNVYSLDELNKIHYKIQNLYKPLNKMSIDSDFIQNDKQ